jgi:hypothetical protein
MTVEDVISLLEGLTRQGRFDATPESLAILEELALRANIHAKIVDISPRAKVDIKDGVVSLSNLEGGLKNNDALRRKTAERLIQTYDLQDVVFAKPVKAKRDHINPFYNFD